MLNIGWIIEILGVFLWNHNLSSSQFSYSLISKLDEVSLFSQPTFKYILPLMDNYIPDVRQSEDHSLEEQMEEDMFLDAIVGM